MKTLARIRSIFFLVFFAFAAFAQPGPNNEAFSENKKFSAEILTAQLSPHLDGLSGVKRIKTTVP